MLIDPNDIGTFFKTSFPKAIVIEVPKEATHLIVTRKSGKKLMIKHFLVSFKSGYILTNKDEDPSVTDADPEVINRGIAEALGRALTHSGELSPLAIGYTNDPEYPVIYGLLGNADKKDPFIRASYMVELPLKEF